MQKIIDHIDACAHNYAAMNSTFVEVRENISNTNKLLVAFMASVAVCVLAFAGYTYVQATTLRDQLTESRAATTTAIAQIPGKTAQAVSDIAAPPAAPEAGNR